MYKASTPTKEEAEEDYCNNFEYLLIKYLGIHIGHHHHTCPSLTDGLYQNSGSKYKPQVRITFQAERNEADRPCRVDVHSHVAFDGRDEGGLKVPFSN